MSDNLGMNTKNVLSMLGLTFGPILMLLGMLFTAYFVGNCEGHRKGVMETDCKDRGGYISGNTCVKEVK